MNKNKFRSFTALLIGFVLVVLSLGYSPASEAACSSYTRFATINELWRQSNNRNTRNYFYEIKALDQTIVTSGAYQNWTFEVCRQRDGRCQSVSMNQSSLVCSGSENYLVLDQGDVPRGFVDFGDGLEVRLTDGSGNLIDYLTVGGYQNLGLAGCSPSELYDYVVGTSNTKDLRRNPDGTGNWEYFPGASGGDTECGNNNGGQGYPELSVNDVGVFAGNPAQLTLTLSATSASDIKINFETADGTAQAGSDYVQTTGSVTIPAGDTTAFINIDTLPTATSGQFFNVLITIASDSLGIATIPDHIANVWFLPQPVGKWWFDETSWNSVSGEVQDRSGNNFNGTAFNGANTSDNIPPDSAIIGNPGTCRFGQFDGSSDYVEIPHDPLLNGSTALTYSAWINPDSWSGTRQVMAKSVHGGGSGRAQMGIFSENGNLRLRAETSIGRINVDTTLPATGTWTHVAGVFDGSNLILYVNGVEANRSSFASTQLIQNNDPINIGKRVGTNQYFFDGYIDEPRIFNMALSQQEVQYVMNEVHQCITSAPTVSGFDISFGAGSASTCTPLPVTITAVDSANNVLTTYSGSVTINTQTAHGDWSAGAPDTPVNPVNNGAADDGEATYQFDPADSGSIDLNLINTHADFLTVSVSDAVAGVTSISAPITFLDNAFVITPITCTGVSCPATGSTEVVAGRDHVFNAALWRRDPSTGDCAIATAYDTGTNAAYGDLKAWITRDASDPAGLSPEIAGAVLGNAAPVNNNLDLSFVAGEAQFTLSTSDVGKYSINLRDDTSGFARDDRGTADTSDDLPITLDGSSSTLTVRPLALGYTDIRQGALVNPGGTATSGDKFVAAGDAFEATIGAYLWQAADDSNNDGLVDNPDTTDVTNNGVTPAYDFSTLLASDLTGGFTPAAGIAGILSGTTNVTGFTSGQATANDLAYSEVGSMRMLATATNFLNTAGVDVSGQTITPVGRFYPHHFEITGVNISPACVAGNFTYMDQPELELDYTVEAHRLGSGITQNYFTGGYSFVGTVNMVAEDSDDGNDLSGRITNIGSASWVTGRYSISTTTAQLDRDTSPDGPFDNLSLGLQVNDPDGAALENMDMDPATAGPCAACTAKSIGTTRVRYGRMELINAHGSELLSLTVPALLQYYDGNNFVINTDDSCSSLLVNDVQLDNDQASAQSGSISISSGTTALTVNTVPAGRIDLNLSAPGASNTGFVDLTPALNLLANMPWLQFDWNGDGTDENPTGRATFGIFPGSPQQIYMQEVY